MSGEHPAFPYKGLWTITIPDPDNLESIGCISTGTQEFSGLSKREWFAGMAMQGLLPAIREFTFEHMCKLSIELADMMIKKLKQSKGDL